MDDENRIKEDFYKKIIEKNKNSTYQDENEEKKTKGELSKEYSKTFGKGFAMLKKIGFQVGKGLGAKEQGITKPLEIKRREKNKGISTEDIIEKQINEDNDYSENEFISNNEIHKHKKLHKLKLKNEQMDKKKKELKHQEAKIKEMDEFEKLVDNWDRLKGILLAQSLNQSKNTEIDLELDVDISKFLLEKKSNHDDFIGFKNGNKSFYNKFNLASFDATKQLHKKRHLNNPQEQMDNYDNSTNAMRIKQFGQIVNIFRFFIYI